MGGLPKSVVICIIPLALLLAAHSSTVNSQTPAELATAFGEALAQVQRVEAAGATPEELAELVSVLNDALELNEQALKLNSPQNKQRQDELLAQVNELLETARSQSVQLEPLAAQRTQNNKILAYVSAAVAAAIATIAYGNAVSIWRKYAIRRTFRMRISPKRVSE